MRMLGQDSVRVSDRGLRYGLPPSVLDRYGAGSGERRARYR
jgi:hypothetical protein